MGQERVLTLWEAWPSIFASYLSVERFLVCNKGSINYNFIVSSAACRSKKPKGCFVKMKEAKNQNTILGGVV